MGTSEDLPIDFKVGVDKAMSPESDVRVKGSNFHFCFCFRKT